MARLAIAGVLCLAAAVAVAQETRGVIFGHISDTSNAAVIAAKVTVTNIDTNVSTSVESGEGGYFEAPLLVSGRYQVLIL